VTRSRMAAAAAEPVQNPVAVVVYQVVLVVHIVVVDMAAVDADLVAEVAHTCQVAHRKELDAVAVVAALAALAVVAAAVDTLRSVAGEAVHIGVHIVVVVAAAVGTAEHTVVIGCTAVVAVEDTAALGHIVHRTVPDTWVEMVPAVAVH
jgi:hypothetical protein